MLTTFAYVVALKNASRNARTLRSSNGSKAKKKENNIEPLR